MAGHGAPSGAGVEWATFDRYGPVRELLDHVTSRWGLLVLLALRVGPRRFSEISRLVEGCGDKMLARSLDQLAADGLITRHAHASVPPRVDYALTDDGAAALESLARLVDWARGHTGVTDQEGGVCSPE